MDGRLNNGKLDTKIFRKIGYEKNGKLDTNKGKLDNKKLKTGHQGKIDTSLIFEKLGTEKLDTSRNIGHQLNF